MTRARAGDERAIDGLARIGRYLGIGIANHGHGDLARHGRDRRRRRGGRRPPVRPDPRGAPRPGANDVARRGRRSSRPSSARGRARSAPRSTAPNRRPTSRHGSSPRLTLERYVPHWRRIEQALRERIADLSPGDALPSDAELCAEFGVSRMTARNAMQRLADEGLVMRVPGRGSFVAEPPAHRRADRLLTFSREMERRGRRPSSRVLNREIRPSTPGRGHGARRPHGRARRRAPPPPARGRRADRDRDGRARPWHRPRGPRRGPRGGVAPRRARRRRLPPAARDRDDRGRTRDPRRRAACSASRRATRCSWSRRVIMDTAGRRIESTESRYPADRYALDILFDVEQEPPP